MNATPAAVSSAPHPLATEDFTLEWRADGAIFTIRRPAKLNAITLPVLDGLERCLSWLPSAAHGGW
jgi:enoyl-CoA hydratase/carnithine racemase